MRVAAFSGHLAVLPAPGVRELSASPVGRILADAGLGAHLALLTPAQFANSNFFHARRFPVALYLGFESYYQSVAQPGDGDAALRNYLGGGGTLLVLPAGPYPMYYNQAGQLANGAAVIGLNIGAGSFEQPPAGLQLTFHVQPHHADLHWPEPVFPFPATPEADPRWRPSRPPGRAGIRYLPWVTLLDERGGNHGEGAALLVHEQGPLRGGRVLYLWCSLWPGENLRPSAVADVLRWALADLARPRRSQLTDDFEGRATVTDDWSYWELAAGDWKLDQSALLGTDMIADRFEIQGAARGHAAWRDYALSVRFKIESRGSDWRDGPWFGLRVRPDGDGYYLTLTRQEAQWHKVIYGISTEPATALTTAPWQPDDQWHTLDVELVANRFKVRLDGRPLLEGIDNAHLNLPSMRHGGVVLAARKSSRSTGHTVVRFDDFNVRLLK